VATPAAGRFAPSPTGPFHLGSLVAAVGSWLFARAAGGSWLLRMEDLDNARVVRGSADEIRRALSRFGLEPDGDVVFQSRRTGRYEEVLRTLKEKGLVYPCGCTRAELVRVASAPAPGDPEDPVRIYPGTCAHGLPDGRPARAFRFRAPEAPIAWEDRLFGRQEESVARSVGDFVVRRADGPFAYQFAVVVDDADQGITDVVRGSDLITSTGRQIALQRALHFPTPAYTHLPLVLGPDGTKLGKRHGALPLATLGESQVRRMLALALAILGQQPPDGTPREMLEEAARRFTPQAIPRTPHRISGL